MNARRQLVLALLLAFGLLAAPARAEVVDRVIAVVNRHPILWSELDEQLRFEALQNVRELNSLAAADRRSAFEHLVQAHILREQMPGSQAARPAEVDARINEIRAFWQQDKDERAWQLTLARYGLTQPQLRRLATAQVETLMFVEYRVRPTVRVSREDIEAYYTQQLAPQAKERGVVLERLEKMTSQIRELLAEQRLNEEMDKWLQSLRTQSSVQVLWSDVK